MNFDSALFIACFLPVSALLYRAFRGDRAKNAFLLIAGLAFYAFSGLGAVALLVALTAVNYVLGRLSARRGAASTAAVILDLGVLAAYKYVAFFLSAFGLGFRGLAAPVGISFFTFKLVSYIVDTRRNRENEAKSFFDLLLYVSFFPQIMAGPITRCRDFAPQLRKRDCGAENLAGGLRRFIFGLAKKAFIASAAAKIADAVFADASAIDIRLAWLGAAAYMLQIYFDFSGYSDMAIGLGRIFGFNTPENFNFPYIAATITDFWRRWHISLSSWLRDYIYIPLGGNRKGKYRTALNKFIVFAACGLWHGAAWTFVAWGAWHGLLSALEGLGVIPIKRITKTRLGRAVGHIYTLLAVCLGFVIFRAESFGSALRVISAMVGAYPASIASTVLLRTLLSAENVILLILGVVFSMPVARAIPETLKTGRLRGISYLFSAVLLVLCLTAVASGGFSPFIYFQF